VRKSVIFLAILAGLVLLSECAFAGAWTHKHGGGYFELKQQIIRANQFYEPDGRKIDIPTLAEYRTAFYGEYGVNDWLTVIAEVPYLHITLNRQLGRPSGFVYFPGDSVSGIADVDVGVRLGLLRDRSTVLSLGLKLGLPLGDDAQENGLLTGDGEFNQLLTLQVGHSFYPRPMYLTGEVGVNNRTNGYSDEFRYEAEIGYTFGGKLTLALKVHGSEPFRNGDDAVMGGMGGLYANNQRYLAFGPAVFYNLYKSLGIGGRVEGATRVQNALSAPALVFGVFLKR
jgi:hypothetical protein